MRRLVRIKWLTSLYYPYLRHEDLVKIKYVGGYLANQIMAHLKNFENRDRSENSDNADDSHPSKTNKRKKSYEPAPRSASFALLIALLAAEEEGLTFLTKADLGKRAQEYANEPILPKTGGRPYGGSSYSYTGWSCMGSTLIKKHLVSKVSSPARFSLTEEGRKLAKSCAATNAKTKNNTVNVYNPKGISGINIATDGGQNPPLSVTSTPRAKRPKSTDTSVVMWALSVVRALETVGHDADELESSMNRVIKSGKQLASELELRLAILDDLARPKSRAPTHTNAGVVDLDDDYTVQSVNLNLNSTSQSLRTNGTAVGGNVFLYLDIREKLGRKATENAEKFAEDIKNSGVPTELRTLPVGDALFVRKCPQTGKETLLNFVAERKIASDFSSSVSDRRIFRQIYSMQNSRLSRATVVLEGSFGGNVDAKHVERLEKTLAEITTFHGIYVKRTRNTKETIAFYRSIYRHLCTQSASISASDGGMDIVFPSWCEEMNAFNNSLTVEQLFLLQMQRVAGVGKKTAQAILDMGYKTIPQLEIALRHLPQDDGPLFLKKQAKKKGITGFNVKNSKSLYLLFTQDSYTT